LEAAKRQDWKSAIGYFTAAQERAHLAPTIMFNLGLAHAKAGNELLADVWLRAYLAAMPDAPNAAAVKAEIGRLEAVVEAKVRRLFEQAVAAAEQLPVERATSGRPSRTEALESVAVSQFQVGDVRGGEATFQRARQAASASGQEAYSSRYYWNNAERLRSMGGFLAEADDIEGAEKILKELLSIKEDDYAKRAGRDSILVAILKAKLRGGDLKGARAIFDQLNENEQNNNSGALSLAYFDGGDSATAEVIAKKGSVALPYTYDDLASRALRRGNISEARKYALQFMALGRQRPGVATRVLAGGDPDKEVRTLAEEKIDGGWGHPGAVNELELLEMTKLLLILGNIPSARRAASFARQWASMPEGKGGLNKGAYASLAEACVLVAEDRRHALKEKIEKAAAAYQTPLWDLQFRKIEREKQSMVLLAIQVGRLEAAEKVADMIILSSMRIDSLRKIGEAYGRKGDAANAARVRMQAAEVDVATRMGWAAKRPSQEKAITAWIAGADKLNQKSMFFDFQNHLDYIKRERPEEIPRQLASAAMEIMKELTRIRAMAARLEKQTN
jgi:tetratricopeptide (TPR) repeat protein